MYWQQRKNPENWIDQLRYFMDHNNELTASELRDAFLAHMYVMEYTSIKLLEDGIIKMLGNDGERFIMLTTTETDIAKEIGDIEYNNGDMRDILGITYNMLDYIEGMDM